MKHRRVMPSELAGSLYCRLSGKYFEFYENKDNQLAYATKNMNFLMEKWVDKKSKRNKKKSGYYYPIDDVGMQPKMNVSDQINQMVNDVELNTAFGSSSGIPSGGLGGIVNKKMRGQGRAT